MNLREIAVREISDPANELPELAEVKDIEIETHEFRAGYSTGEGIVCLSLLPGDEAGQIIVNVQFEGPVGAWEECNQQQSIHLAEAWRWVREFLEANFKGEYRVELDMVPCPKAGTRIELPHEVATALNKGVRNLPSLAFAQAPAGLSL